jgi:hypothetical protein
MPNNLGWDTLIIISEDVIGHICELGNSKMYHVHLVAVADDKLIKSCFARRMNDAIKEVKKVINKSQIEANASID